MNDDEQTNALGGLDKFFYSTMTIYLALLLFVNILERLDAPEALVMRLYGVTAIAFGGFLLSLALFVMRAARRETLKLLNRWFK